MTKSLNIIQVAVPVPMLTLFDYLPTEEMDIELLLPGTRVWVPFGRRKVVGIVIGITDQTNLSSSKLKHILEVIDAEPVLPESLLKLVDWASRYYHYPMGEVFRSVMPAMLRRGLPAEEKHRKAKKMKVEGEGAQSAIFAKREGLLPMQATLCQDGNESYMDVAFGASIGSSPSWYSSDKQPQLNPAQQTAVDSICKSLGIFTSFLLDGVTGSGKTEVYIKVIEEVVQRGGQALVLVPEIGLTPQTVARFESQLNCLVIVLHSNLTERARLNAWLMAKNNRVSVVIGTRSAIFTPMLKLGVIVVDEEHDASYKQQDGFRYSARDLAIVRAQLEAIPVVLGSATPSLESQHNVANQRYQLLNLPERAGNAQVPSLNIIDVRNEKLNEGLSKTLLRAIGAHIQRGKQVLLFLNRRGYAPILICHHCGWVANCEHCDATVVLHHSPYQLCCHHCNKIYSVLNKCPACQGTKLVGVGLGTERIEKILQQEFPNVGIARIDKDSTRLKGSWDAFLESFHTGSNSIFIGTQMLAKGHHFPNVTCVGIIDADVGFLSADMRASERMGQLITQVAGRAGRGEAAGEVFIQTRHPQHPLMRCLVDEGYKSFSQALLLERKQAGLMPYAAMALLRAEARVQKEIMDFLNQVRIEMIKMSLPLISILGPVLSPMERKEGRYRAQLLLQSPNRTNLHQCLSRLIDCIELINSKQRIHWLLDIDPIELI